MRRQEWLICLALLVIAGAAHAETKAECNTKLQQAQAAGIIYKIAMVGATPTIVIDKQVFAGLPFDAKQNIVDTLNCALFDDGRKLSEVEIISNASHKRLARWTGYKGLSVD